MITITQLGVLSKPAKEEIQPLVLVLTSQPLHNNCGILIIYTMTMHGMSCLSHEVTNIHRGEAEVDIKLPSGINRDILNDSKH